MTWWRCHNEEEEGAGPVSVDIAITTICLITVCHLNSKLMQQILYWWYISSVECKKVVSDFLSFCRKGNFVFRFPLYFIVFWRLICSIKMSILWVETCIIAKNVSFYLHFWYLQETQFYQKCHLRPSCIHMTIYKLLTAEGPIRVS